MNDPIVTIAIPTRDHADLLDDAIISALDQDIENKEILLIDNRSKDNTPEICKEYESNLIA